MLPKRPLILIALTFVTNLIPLFVVARSVPAQDRPYVPLLAWTDADGQPVFPTAPPWYQDEATLHAEVERLRGLSWLDLKYRNLNRVPPACGLLHKLEGIDLYNNQITRLPPELGQLSNLQQIWLDGNRLTALPKELGDLENLAVLRVFGNPLPPEYPAYDTQALLEYLRSLPD